MTSTENPTSFAFSVLRLFYRAMVGAYGLNVWLYLGVRLILSDEWLLVQFFDTFLHLLLLPSFVLFLMSLFLREWRLSTVMLSLMAVFALFWGQQFIPDRAPTAGDGTVIRVYSHNLLGRNPDIELAVNAIRVQDAPVVALQEVSKSHAQALDDRLADSYPYRALHYGEHPTQGQGILSRYPILEDDYWQYDYLPFPLGYQRVRLALPDESALVIYNVHPTHPGMSGSFFDPAYRQREIRDLIAHATQENDPTLLIGDFNMPPLSPDYKHITDHYGDVFGSVGFGMGWTFPIGYNTPPFLRLDYAFHDEAILPLAAQVGQEVWGSDHLPLLVTIELKRAKD